MTSIPGTYGLYRGSAGPVANISLLSVTNGDSSQTMAWPAGIQAGDVAILIDRAALLTGAPPASVTPTGFTVITDDQITQASGQVSQRLVTSYRVLDGSETGSISGMVANGGAKILYIIRGDSPIVAVAPSAFNHVATAADPAAQTVSASGQPTPLIVLGVAIASNGSAAFTTATPAFDATQPGGIASPAIAGYKIYNASAANHTVDMADLGVNILISGYLKFS